MRIIKLMLLLITVSLVLSSCYTRLAIAKRETYYIPREQVQETEIVDDVEVDTIYVDEDEYYEPYNDYYDRNFRRYRHANNPWYWDDYYFDLAFYGHHGYPNYWYDYYWHRPYIACYPWYYHDYYWGGHGWYGHGGRHNDKYYSSNFKARKFDKHGRVVQRGGTRIGTKTVRSTANDFRATRTVSSNAVAKRAVSKRKGAVTNAKRRGYDNTQPVRTANRTVVSRRSDNSKTAGKTVLRSSAKTRKAAPKTAQIVKKNRETTRKVRYVVRKSNNRRSKTGSAARSSKGTKSSKNSGSSKSSSKIKSSSKSSSKSVNKSSSSSRNSGSSYGSSRSSSSSSSRSSVSRSSGSSSSRSSGSRSSSKSSSRKK